MTDAGKKAENPREVYLSFYPNGDDEAYRVRASDTAPFIAGDQNPEWYIKASEFATLEARATAAEERVKELEAKYESRPTWAPCAICGGEQDNDLLTDICCACEQRICEEGSP